MSQGFCDQCEEWSTALIILPNEGRGQQFMTRHMAVPEQSHLTVGDPNSS